MKTILVPTDFSKCADDALHVAAQIAKTTKAQIHLVHVSEIVTQADALIEYWSEPELEQQYIKSLLAGVKKALHKQIQQEKFKHIEITVHAEIGNIIPKINEIAINLGADLIVMGTKGASDFEEVSVGTISEKIVRNAICPVIVVSSQVENFKLNKVVFPTTLQENQGIAFEKLRKFQDIFNFEVLFLYLNNPLELIQKDEAKGKMDILCQKFGLKNTTVHTMDALDEESAIYEFAEKNKADMIVMATHQRKGLLHFLYGSLTEAVANHSTLPVLSLSMAHQ